MGFCVHLGVVIRVEHHLGQAFLVPQVHKNNTTVIPAALHPSHEDNLLAHVRRSQRTTMMGSSHISKRI
jgi:hypothetical protein